MKNTKTLIAQIMTPQLSNLQITAIVNAWCILNKPSLPTNQPLSSHILTSWSSNLHIHQNIIQPYFYKLAQHKDILRPNQLHMILFNTLSTLSTVYFHENLPRP